MHNDVIKSDIHSTDTHGYTEAIFGVMHLLGFSYAPRIKNFKRQKLYLFNSHKDVDRSTWAIKPSGYINAELIEKHWDDILRFVVTIKLKETSASDLFRRLNSYSKQHALYTALKAFGRILKSILLGFRRRVLASGSMPPVAVAASAWVVLVSVSDFSSAPRGF